MATAAFDLHAHISDLTECSICLEDFKDPRSLPCLHTFCLKCLESHCQGKLFGDEVLCPVCRDSFHVPEAGVSAFPVNFFVNDLLCAQKASALVTNESLHCETCIEMSQGEKTTVPLATKYCVDCSQHVCENCSSKIHVKIGAHHVVPLGEEMSAEELMHLQKRNCKEHKGETFKLFCYDCKSNLCSICACLKHRLHNFTEISEAAAEIGQENDEHVEEVSDCITNIDSLEQKWNLHVQKFLAQADTIEVTVKQKGEEKKQLVDSHVENLLEELRCMKSSYLKEVECNKESLQTTAVAMLSYVNYSCMVRTKGRQEDITHVGEELKTRATTLLQTDILSKNPQAPDIVFVPTDDHTFSDAEGGLNSVGRLACQKGTDNTDDQESESSAEEALSELCCAKSMPQSVRQSDAATDTVAVSTSSSSSSLTDDETAQSLSPSAQKENRTPPKTPRKIQEMYGFALAMLDDELFLLKSNTTNQLNVYDAMHYTERGTIYVPHVFLNIVDMAACCFYKCLYIADASLQIAKVKLPSQLCKWKVDGINAITAITVTSSHFVLVYGRCMPNLLKLYNTDGVAHIAVELQADIRGVNCADELMPGQYVVTHGYDLHRVCVVNSEGKLLHAYGGFKGSYGALLNSPGDVVIDDEFLYVVEQSRNRLLVLTPELECIHCIPEFDCSSSSPVRLKIDKERRRLFVRRLCGQNHFLTVFQM